MMACATALHILTYAYISPSDECDTKIGEWWPRFSSETMQTLKSFHIHTFNQRERQAKNYLFKNIYICIVIYEYMQHKNR